MLIWKHFSMRKSQTSTKLLRKPTPTRNMISQVEIAFSVFNDPTWLSFSKSFWLWRLSDLWSSVQEPEEVSFRLQTSGTWQTFNFVSMSGPQMFTSGSTIGTKCTSCDSILVKSMTYQEIEKENWVVGNPLLASFGKSNFILYLTNNMVTRIALTRETCLY